MNGEQPPKNNNVVLSIVVLLSDVQDVNAIGDIYNYISKYFNYFELVVIGNPSDVTSYKEGSILSIPNSRLIILNDNAPDNILRQLAFEQTIGDYVVLFDPKEAEIEHIKTLTDSSMDGYDFASLAYTKSDNRLYEIFSKIFFCIISKLSGYNLNNMTSYTGCYSRAVVNVINEKGLGQTNLRLLLASIGFKNTAIQGAERKSRNLNYILKRLEGSLDIIGSVPHRLLSVTAWLSLAACLGNIFYIIYTLSIWLYAKNVQPGWTSTALVQSVLFSILFFSIFVFSCIFSATIGKNRQNRFTVARNVSRSDFISSFKELNVTDKQ